MTKFMTTTQARKVFYDVIETAKHPGTPVVITHKGIPEVVIMSFEEFEGWQETMEIMADPDPTMRKDLLRGIRDMKAGRIPKDAIPYDEFRKKLKL